MPVIPEVKNSAVVKFNSAFAPLSIPEVQNWWATPVVYTVTIVIDSISIVQPWNVITITMCIHGFTIISTGNHFAPVRTPLCFVVGALLGQRTGHASEPTSGRVAYTGITFVTNHASVGYTTHTALGIIQWTLSTRFLCICRLITGK